MKILSIVIILAVLMVTHFLSLGFGAAWEGGSKSKGESRICAAWVAFLAILAGVIAIHVTNLTGGN